MALLGASMTSYFCPSALLSTPFLQPSQLASASNMRNKQALVRKVKITELVSEKLMLGGSKMNPTVITVFYDSRVGTHQEYISVLGVKQIFDRVNVDQILLVDLAEMTDGEK